MKTETHQVMIDILANLVAANQIQKDFQKSLDNGFNMIEATLSTPSTNEQTTIL